MACRMYRNTWLDIHEPRQNLFSDNESAHSHHDHRPGAGASSASPAHRNSIQLTTFRNARQDERLRGLDSQSTLQVAPDNLARLGKSEDDSLDSPNSGGRSFSGNDSMYK